jgi:4a-hydroxytetrahydrobiopterin dehydratase
MTKPAVLDPSVVAEALTGTHWQVVGATLRLERKLDSFAQALGFVTSVGVFADRADHHPDIHLSYRTVVLEMHTHEVSALSQRDVDLALEVAGL